MATKRKTAKKPAKKAAGKVAKKPTKRKAAKRSKKAAKKAPGKPKGKKKPARVARKAEKKPCRSQGSSRPSAAAPKVEPPKDVPPMLGGVAPSTVGNDESEENRGSGYFREESNGRMRKVVRLFAFCSAWWWTADERSRTLAVILALLSALNLVNYLDRILVAAVGPKVQEDLRAHRFSVRHRRQQLHGRVLPHQPDLRRARRSLPRRELIALGVAVWSIATAASGMMRTFVAMLGMRVIVGVGEASYATLAPTIIDDLAAAVDEEPLALGLLRRHPGRLGARLSARRLSRAPLRVAQRVLHRGGPGCPRAPVLALEEPTGSVRTKDTARAEQQHMGHLA